MHKGIWDTFRRHRDCYFQVITNGMLFTEANVRRLKELGNVTPLVSLDGFEQQNDLRRGEGVWESADQGLDRLRKAGILFGIACTVTGKNMDETMSDAYLEHFIKKGAMYIWYYVYRPVGEDPHPEYCMTPDQIVETAAACSGCCRKHPIVIIDSYWTADGEAFCPAAMGLGFHVGPQGSIEPCPPLSFATERVCDNGGDVYKSINESEFLRGFQNFVQKRTKGCVILEHPQELVQYFRDTGAQDYSTRDALAELDASTPAAASTSPAARSPRTSGSIACSRRMSSSAWAHCNPSGWFQPARTTPRSRTFCWSHPMKRTTTALLLVALCCPSVQSQEIKVEETKDYIQVDTDALEARIRKTGYVSGIAQGTFLDKKTGARDPGFGLHIMDFLLGPGWKDDSYGRDEKYARQAAESLHRGAADLHAGEAARPVVVRGKDCVAVKMSFRFTQPDTTASSPAPCGSRRSSSSRQALRPVRRTHHLGQRRRQPDLSHRHAGPRQAQGRRHVFADLPELLTARFRPPSSSRTSRPMRAPLPARQGQGAAPPHDPRLPAPAGDKAGPWLGGLTLDPASPTGLVPSARLRLLHPGAVRQERQGGRHHRRRLHRWLLRQHRQHERGLRSVSKHALSGLARFQEGELTRQP